MKTEWSNTINAMRDEGYLVIIWSPAELGDVETSHIEDLLIERGNDMIEQLQQPATDETRSYGPQGETA